MVTKLFLLASFAAVLSQIPSEDDWSSALRQSVVHDIVKRKHNSKNINLTHIKRERGERRQQPYTASVTTLDQRPYLPLQNSQAFNQSITPTLWQPPTHNRSWRYEHHSQHTWERVSTALTELLYAPIEVGYNRSPFPSLSTDSFTSATVPLHELADSHHNKKRTTKKSKATPSNQHTGDTMSWTVPSGVNMIDYPQCLLGCYKDNGFVSQDRHVLPKCTSRGMWDRDGLRSRWKDLHSDASMGPLKSLATLFQSKRNLTNIVFLGDSISSQLAQALVCDLIRAGNTHTLNTQLTVRAYNETVTEFIVPRNQDQAQQGNGESHGDDSLLLRIYNKRFDLPCLNNEMGSAFRCDSSSPPNVSTASRLSNESMTSEDLLITNEKFIFDFTSSLLHHFSGAALSLRHEHDQISSNLSSRTIVLFNSGLHLQESDRWVLRPVAAALYKTAQSHAWQHPSGEENIYLFRETSSQAFSFSTDGYHRRTTEKTHSNDFCCRLPLESPFNNNWRNNNVITHLHRIDSAWRKVVGWVPLFNTTLELFDMHVEFNSRTGVVDCTHFFYMPNIFSVVWRDISEALSRTVDWVYH